MGKKKVAVLTCDCINEGRFLLETDVWLFCQAAKKKGRNNEVTVRRGSTVVATHYLA